MLRHVAGVGMGWGGDASWKAFSHSFSMKCVSYLHVCIPKMLPVHLE